MKDYDNSNFYHSTAWKRVSTAYMTSKNYICERCGRPAVICHHKKYLNGHNVADPATALSFDNLEALCQDCHNKEHFSKSRTQFDNDGNVISVRKTEEEKQFENDQRKIDELLKKMTAHTALHGLRSESVEDLSRAHTKPLSGASEWLDEVFSLTGEGGVEK